jgi:hypothetical protein
MNIDGRFLRQIKAYNVAYIRYIKTPGTQVCGYQPTHLTGSKVSHCGAPLISVLV